MGREDYRALASILLKQKKMSNPVAYSQLKADILAMCSRHPDFDERKFNQFIANMTV